MGRFWTCSIQIQQIYRTIVIHFIRRVHLGEWKRHTSCPEPTDILHVVPNLQNLATIGAVPNKVTTADFINNDISKDHEKQILTWFRKALRISCRG
uniref:Uncharacterized protein n=1 Tax=Triticum urartu TaxID=4572 RepID=A0A8R7PZS2_TRIUA